MSFRLTEPAQLHRQTFTVGNGVPPPPVAEGSFWQCVRAWTAMPIGEQPFYFLSFENGDDFGFDHLLHLEGKTAAG